MSFSIAGKTAIVTGAANGIGRAIARQFIDKGANVVFADRDEARLKKEVGQLDSEEGQARAFHGDLREKLNQANLLSATIDAFDRVDILVNAARHIETSNPLDPEDSSVESMLEQNLMTSLRLSQLIARRMIRQSETRDQDEDEEIAGTIINLSSIASRHTRSGLMGYSIATAAIDQMTRSMAVALAPKRIRVNAIAFGSLMSASMKKALKENETMRDTIVAQTPLDRIAGPNELADVAQFLAAEASGFMTGQILTVDGGRTLLDPVDTTAH